MSRSKTTLFELRSGAIDAVHLVVKTPDFAALTEALLSEIAVSPLFAAADLRVAPASPGKAAISSAKAGVCGGGGSPL